jgi:hypothetical protein
VQMPKFEKGDGIASRLHKEWSLTPFKAGRIFYLLVALMADLSAYLRFIEVE